jgi:diguanylate cyclase (GGDEF)-like protein
LWLFLCLMLAGSAIYNFSQMNILQDEVAKRRLIETSLQDLVVQSASLRYLETRDTPESQISRLNRMGYSSTKELVYQLGTRLSIIDALATEYKISEWTSQMKSFLDQVRTIQDLSKTSEQERQMLSHTMDEWFITLIALNGYVKHLSSEQDDRSATLQRNNVVLAIAVLVFSLCLAAINIWKRSELSKRFETEVVYLSNQARTDPLTGILNRRGWIEYTTKHLKRTAREGRRPSSLAIIDIDYFKQYNDTFGHDAGDERLKLFASLLRQNFRPGDLIARVGGEEFAVLLLNCSVEDSKRIVDRIRETGTCDIAFSAGLTSIEDHESIVRAMAVADQALYQAKNKGRNCSRIAYG